MKRDREEEPDVKAEEAGVAGQEEGVEPSPAKRQRTSEGSAADGKPEDAKPSTLPGVKQDPGDAGPSGVAVGPGPSSEAGEDDDGDDAFALPRSTSRAAVKRGAECPYLDTISRQVGHTRDS
jgi:hypothetical protein